MRKNRFSSSPAYHKPIGKSNTIKGANMSPQELVKSTSLAFQRQLASSFLTEEYPDGVPDDRILDEVDLSQTPLDLTDAQRLIEYAQKQIRDRYEAELAQKKKMSRNLASKIAKSPKPAESSVKVNIE